MIRNMVSQMVTQSDAFNEAVSTVRDKASETLDHLKPSEHLKDRFRSLELHIVNKTGHPLEFGNRYFFHSGKFFTHPPDLLKGGTSARCQVCNVEGTIMQGVTGAVAFKILGTSLYLHIGFCNPSVGTYKHYIGISEDQPPKYGYDECVDALPLQPIQVTHHPFKLYADITDGEVAHKLFTYTIEHADLM